MIEALLAGGASPDRNLPKAGAIARRCGPLWLQRTLRQRQRVGSGGKGSKARVGIWWVDC